MELHTLKPSKGSTKKRRRIGRGEGSGKGGTATRGHKGQQSRSGYSKKRNFEGGQMPLQMRLPKRGFKNPNRVEYTAINISDLQKIAEKYKVDSIDLTFLVDQRIVRKNDRVKVLAKGSLDKKLKVEAHAFSAKAKEAIEAKGGTVNTPE